MFSGCLHAIYNFRLRAYYYPGVRNTLADAASRLHEPQGVARLLTLLAGTHTNPVLCSRPALFYQETGAAYCNLPCPVMLLDTSTKHRRHIGLTGIRIPDGAFCRAIGCTLVPATTDILCKYAAMLARSLNYNSVMQYLNIIRILHLEWDLPNPGWIHVLCKVFIVM